LDKLGELLPISSQILALNLMETRIKDSDFSIITKLTNLTSLVLSDNPFGNEAMPSITVLRKLRTLEMVHTKVTDIGLENLLPLNMLERLDIGCNLLKNAGIKTISQIPSLIDVDVRACEFDATVLPLFFNLPNLKRLNISKNKLEIGSLEAFLSQAKEKNIEVKAEETL
jgi:Leucine-rich repeat (LRR) protein